MPRLDDLAYLGHIRGESSRFRDVLAHCDADDRVPSCPDWDAADLLWHLAEVQLFWARVVRHRPARPDDIEEPPAERPPAYDRLLEVFDEHSQALVTELSRADPEDVAWHWSGDLRVATTLRRQAHEALIHRVDAELTAGVAVSSPDPALADDGVAEVLGVMYGGQPPWGSFTPSGPTVAVTMTDTGTQLRVALGTFAGTDPDSGQVYADEDSIALVEPGGPEPEATISGTAADLDVWLWQRAPAARIHVQGDPSVRERLTAILAQPIN